jgi:predicted nucleotidyltransferase
MQSELLDITGKIDLATLSAFQIVADVARGFGVPYVVVGATARDLVLHHHYGAKIQRATQDLDFAIQVPDWSAFQVLKERLLERGFVADKQRQRLRNESGVIIDIIPFGPVASQGSHISWPPEGDIVMNVLGLQEAFDNAVSVRLRTDPVIDVDVVNPVGLMVLKLVSWTERDPHNRKKDAKDVFFVLSSYEEIPVVRDAYYEDAALIEAYDGDITLGTAELLGRHVSEILKSPTRRLVDQLLRDGILGRTTERLVMDSCNAGLHQFVRHRTLLEAFIKGLNE